MNRSPKRLGRIGEGKFRNWADEAGLTVTEPDADEKGWDRFVEWTLSDEELGGRRVPLDRDDREVKALIQIKTTTSQPGSWPIKLSNWKSLVEHPGPSFFVVLEVDDTGVGVKVEHLYVVHIWEAHIERFLKRLRELDHDAANVPTDLRKRKMSFSYTGDDRLEAPYPTALREALSLPFKAGPDRYSNDKQRIRRRVGYPGGQVPVHIKVTAKVPPEYEGDAEEHFTDVMLGAVPLKPTSGNLSDIRFGIKSKPRDLPEGAEMQINARKVPVRLRFRRSGTFRRIRLNAQMQDARFPTEKGTRGKVCFLTPHGSMKFVLLEEGIRFEFGFSVLGHAEGRLDELWQVLQLATFLREAFENGKSVQIQLKKQRTSSWEDFYQLRDEQRKAGDLAKQLEDPISQVLISVVRSTRSLARSADLPEDIKVVPEQLAAYQPQLSLFNSLRSIERNGAASHAVYLGIYAEDLTAEIEDHISETPVGMAELTVVNLGSQVVVIAFAVSGPVTLICESSDSEGRTFTSESVSEEEARGFLETLPPDTYGYKFAIDSVDYLECFVFGSGDDLPEEVELKEEALKKAQALYGATFTRIDGHLCVSINE